MVSLHPFISSCVGCRLLLWKFPAKWTPLCWEVYAPELPCVLWGALPVLLTVEIAFVMMSHSVLQDWNITSGCLQTFMPCMLSSNFFLLVSQILWQSFVRDFKSDPNGICYLCGLFLQVSSSLLTHTLIHSAVSVWLGERHHGLAMWPHNAPGVLTWHAHSCSVSPLTLDSLVLFSLLFNTPLASERGTDTVPLRYYNTQLTKPW
jgi:hypothetical protein